MERDVRDRRKDRRVLSRILIKYGKAEQFFTDYIQNISRGGIFVPTYNPLPEGTQLRISFSLPSWEHLIETEGVVVHSIHNEAALGTLPSGMGIQFQALSKENLRLIDRYVNSLQA